MNRQAPGSDQHHIEPRLQVGQVRLAEAYADIFAASQIVAAQILLTLGDTEERHRYLNARATLSPLTGQSWIAHGLFG